MTLKRTTVYADSDDLAVIKEAAAREGIAEAEIIREAIHLAALSKRVWNEPLAWPRFNSANDPATRSGEDVLDNVWDEKARAYEENKRGRQ
ncbi:MAG TPA: CopG family transcriptional regulator [Streptomyces sp.]